MRTGTCSKARDDLQAVIDTVVADRAPVMITQPSGEHVVLASASAWTGTEETLYLLSSSAKAKHLLDGIARFNVGAGE